MRKFVLTTLFVCISMFTFAQSGKVVITVLDAQSKEGVPGAVVELAPASNPDKTKQYISAYGGKTSIPSTRYGEYNVTVSAGACPIYANMDMELQDALAIADEKLYVDKQNRVKNVEKN